MHRCLSFNELLFSYQNLVHSLQIALDRRLAFLDQGVLRIRTSVDSFILRHRELSRILASVQFPGSSEGSYNSVFVVSGEGSLRILPWMRLLSPLCKNDPFSNFWTEN